MTEYTNAFFKTIREGSLRSASKIVPLILQITEAKNVIDIGCGTACWLSIFNKHGLEVLGVDGEYVDLDLLEIDKNFFHQKDVGKPFSLGKKFDLVVSLEVAEHLFAQDADQFIDNLIAHGNVILFSAAVPMQGGTHHVNEQWPQYWADKFKAKGFICIDYFRPKIWNETDIEWWYSQNLMLYVKETETALLASLKQWQTAQPMPLVHPRTYVEKMTLAQQQLQELQKQLTQSQEQNLINSDLQQVAAKDLVKAVFKKCVKKASALTNV